jgi:hypothetical protein
MNYRHIYCKIISYAKSQNRTRKNGDYYECHHILPKSLFPLWKNRKSNKVLLTAREHFFVHQLLTKIYPGSEMTFAIHAFVSRPNADYKITSREYERIKKSFSKLQSERMTGREVSKETGELISKRRKELLSDDDNLKKLKANFKNARKASAEARIKNTERMMAAVPDIIKNETIDRLKEYDKLYGLTSTVYRQKRVECECPVCKNIFTSGLKFFITGQRKDFICGRCRNRERMKNFNSSVEWRYKNGLISDEEYNQYRIKRYNK